MSALAHIPIIIAAQLIAYGLMKLGVTIILVFGILAVFAGFWREVTQREYQVIEASPSRLRRDMPWYAGLKFWEWNKHSKIETLLTIPPIIIVWLILR